MRAEDEAMLKMRAEIKEAAEMEQAILECENKRKAAELESKAANEAAERLREEQLLMEIAKEMGDEADRKRLPSMNEMVFHAAAYRDGKLGQVTASLFLLAPVFRWMMGLFGQFFSIINNQDLLDEQERELVGLFLGKCKAVGKWVFADEQCDIEWLTHCLISNANLKQVGDVLVQVLEAKYQIPVLYHPNLLQSVRFYGHVAAESVVCMKHLRAILLEIYNDSYYLVPYISMIRDNPLVCSQALDRAMTRLKASIPSIPFFCTKRPLSYASFMKSSSCGVAFRFVEKE